MSGSLTFPNSPVAGQTVTTNGQTFIYDGESWRLSGPANAIINSVNGSSLGGFRNVLLNGDFRVWQRGTSFTNPVSGTSGFTADRWRVDYDGTGATRTITFNSAITTANNGAVPLDAGLLYFLRYNQSVAGSGGTFNAFQQRVESVFTLQGGPITLSYYARAAAATTLPTVNVAQNYGTGGSPTAQVITTLATNVALTTEWRRYSHTVFLPLATGTLGTNNDHFLGFRFFMPLNQTFTVDITGVQLERGLFASPFEHRPRALELMMCMRYAVRMTLHMQSPDSNAGTSHTQPVHFPVPMRATPTRTLLSAGLTGGSATIINEGARDNLSAIFQVTASANSAYWIDRVNLYSAEL